MDLSVQVHCILGRKCLPFLWVVLVEVDHQLKNLSRPYLSACSSLTAVFPRHLFSFHSPPPFAVPPFLPPCADVDTDKGVHSVWSAAKWFCLHEFRAISDDGHVDPLSWPFPPCVLIFTSCRPHTFPVLLCVFVTLLTHFLMILWSLIHIFGPRTEAIIYSFLIESMLHPFLTIRRVI